MSRAQSDEFFAALTSFIDDPPESNQERADKGEVFIAGLNMRLRGIDAQRGITLFAYGGLIHRLKTKESWRLFPEMGEAWCQFSHFAEKHLGMSLSRANAMELVWRKSQDAGLEPEEIEEIGWDAARTLLMVANNRHDTERLLEAYRKSANREEFKQRVREEKNKQRGGGDVSVEMGKRSFFLVRDEEERFVTESLEMAAKKVGKELGVSMSRTDALMLIVTAWRGVQP